MNLADALADVETRQRRLECGVARAVAKLNADDSAALLAVLATERPSTQIEQALAAIGHKVSAYTLNRHRQAKCSCRVAQ